MNNSNTSSETGDSSPNPGPTSFLKKSHSSPVLFLILGLTITFISGVLYSLNKTTSEMVAAVDLVAFAFICYSLFLVFRNIGASRTILWMLSLGSVLALSRQFLNLIRKIEPFESFFAVGVPHIAMDVSRYLAATAGIGFLGTGMILALFEIREQHRLSNTERARLAEEVAAREAAEREVRKHQEELEKRVEERTRELTHEVEERRAAVQALRESEERFQLALEGSNNGVWDWNAKTDEIYFSPHWKSMVGYSDDQLENRRETWEELLPPEDLKHSMDSYHEAVKHKETYLKQEFRMRHKDGHLVDILSQAFLVYDSKGLLNRMVGTHQDITDRKKAHADLQERESKYRAAIETSYDGFLTVDMEGFVQDVNQTYVDRSGYTAEELTGKHICELNARLNRDEVQTKIEIAREKGHLFFETLHRAKNGTVWPVEVNIAYWPEVEGILFVFLRDILRRKTSETLIHARMQLSEMSERTTLFDLIRAALDIAEELTESQIGYLHFVEDDQEHLTLQAWSTQTIESGCQILTGEHYPISKAGVWADCFRERRPVIHNDYENLPHKRGLPEGHTPVIREMGVPVIRDEKVVAIIGVGNKPTEYNQGDVETLSNLSSLVIDLIEKKRAEDALKTSEKALRRAQEISVMGSFIYDFPADEFILSEMGNRIFGLKEDEVLTRESLNNKIIHPDDRDSVLRAHREALTTGHFDVIHRLSPGLGAKWVRVRSEFEFDSEGNPFRIDGTVQDVTETKRMQEERLELERQLLHSQKLESLGILAGGIAHDFNNILMAILGNLDLVAQDLPPTSTAYDGVDQAIKATRRATDLTQQMLAYSGKGRFVTRRFDLSDMVRENTELFRATVARNVTLRTHLTPTPILIEADPGQVQQVIVNLLTNAVEAIGDGPGGVTLGTGLVNETEETLAGSRLEEKPKPGAFACLRVTDNGCGMDEETLERLFDPFYTTKFTGRGLGMSALMGIVRGHKGAIRVESEAGKGSTIEVCFPLAESIDSHESGESKRKKEPSTFEGLNLHALVVDDEPSVRRLATQYLKRLGVECTQANDGLEAVEAFQLDPEKFDFVLLDLTMPRMDGIATIRELRAIDPEAKVILSSGYSEQEAGTRLGDVGFSAFLQKPYQKQNLQEKIERLIPNNNH